MPSFAARVHRGVLLTVLYGGVTLAHAQELRSSLPQAAEQAFLDCQSEENALYTTAAASAPGNAQATALVRAAIEQLKANLKAELLAAPAENSARPPAKETLDEWGCANIENAR